MGRGEGPLSTHLGRSPQLSQLGHCRRKAGRRAQRRSNGTDDDAEAAPCAGKAARFSASPQSTGRFDHLLRTRSVIYHCPTRSRRRSLSHGHPASGECRINQTSETPVGGIYTFAETQSIGPSGSLLTNKLLDRRAVRRFPRMPDFFTKWPLAAGVCLGGRR